MVSIFSLICVDMDIVFAIPRSIHLVLKYCDCKVYDNAAWQKSIYLDSMERFVTLIDIMSAIPTFQYQQGL